MKVNDVVKIKPNLKHYDNKMQIPNYIVDDEWIVMSIKGDRVIIDKNIFGTESICSPININDLEIVKSHDRTIHISNVGLNFIMEFEGFYIKAYHCHAVVWTIEHIEGINEGDNITKQQAIDMLNNNMKRYEAYVNDYIKAGIISFTLNQNMFYALISFCYNYRNGNLKKLVNGRNESQVADTMLLYNKANGKEFAGLTRRRKVERELFLRK